MEQNCSLMVRTDNREASMPRPVTVPSEEEYTTKTVERHDDVWTVEITRKSKAGRPQTRGFVNVGSISHLLSVVEHDQDE
jgi:hypothetical protein